MAQKKSINIEEVFASLTSSQRRVCLAFGKYVSAGKKSIDLGKALYKGHDRERTADTSISPFLKSIGAAPAQSISTSRKVAIKPNVDYQESIRGFEMIPDLFLKSGFAQGNEKTWDVIGVCFFRANKKENLDSLAKTYRFCVQGRDVQKILGWPAKPKSTVKKPIQNAIDKINERSAQTGISVKPVGPEDSYVHMEKYLDEMCLEFRFDPKFAKKYLAAFDMKPAIQKSKTSKIIPAIPEPAVEAQQLKFSNNEFENLTDEEFATALEKMASALRSRHSRKVAQA